MLEQRIQQQFTETGDLFYQLAASLSGPIDSAAQAIINCVTNGGKLLLCGQGCGASYASLLTSKLMGRYNRERPGLPCCNLQSDAALLSALELDYGAEQVFTKQILALGVPGDILFIFANQAETQPLVQAVQAAFTKDMTVVACTGSAQSELATLLRDVDVHIAIGHTQPLRVEVLQAAIFHCLCDGVDFHLLGMEES